MNKITKYVTTGAAAMLMLMSVGAVQTNVNAARHYRVRVSRYAKKNVRHSNKRHANKRYNHKQRKAQKSRKAKAQRLTKQNKKQMRMIVKNYSHKVNKRNAKRNKRNVKRNVNRVNRRRGRRHAKQTILKPRYQVVPDKLNKRAQKRWQRALNKSGFVDGYAMSIASAAHGIPIPESEANYIFSKYAPNDHRAIIPAYMNPKMEKLNRAVPIKGYRDVNNDVWFQGYFGLKSTKHNTKHPKAYMYQPKAHGWVLLKR